MNRLKNLVAKANSGLSLRSETKQKFGLGSFIAASVSEMLSIRGGYGGGYSGSSYSGSSDCAYYTGCSTHCVERTVTPGGWRYRCSHCCVA